MLNRDFYIENEVGILRSGKGYKLEGKERNADREWNNYL